MLFMFCVVFLLLQNAIAFSVRRPVRPDDPQPACGRTPVPPDLSPRGFELISGGTKAVPFSWPWHVRISAYEGNAFTFRCSGSIIGQNWVLTTGRCLHSGTFDKTKFAVHAAVQDIFNMSTSEQFAWVKSTHFPPGFDPKSESVLNDFALVELSSALSYSDHVQAVCLTSYDSDAVVPPNSAFLTGWGATESEETPRVLYQGQISFQESDTCQSTYQAGYNETLQLCAGDSTGNACTGDEGGPLVAHAGDRLWYQLGIASTTSCSSGDSGLFTRVSAYCDFIATTTKSAVLCLQP